jgi:hypothetical protein
MAKKKRANYDPAAETVAVSEADALVNEIEVAQVLDSEALPAAPKADADWMEYQPDQPFSQDIQRRIDRKAPNVVFHGTDAAEMTMANKSVVRVTLQNGKIVRCQVKA